MAIQRSVLLIADIGGYTRFMKEHRFGLAHAQDTVARLLETVIDASRPLKLAKLEGDAAFMYAPIKDAGTLQAVAKTVTNIRRAFLSKREELAINATCPCQGCTTVDRLSLKFVAHAGDVAFQKVKRYTELAGVDVILVHRMLKNDVPVPEYVLMTDPIIQDLDPELRRFARELAHDFEGLGHTQTHYIDFAEIAADLPPALQKSAFGKLWDRILLNVRTAPIWLGLKKPCEGFKNVEIADEAPQLSAGEPP